MENNDNSYCQSICIPDYYRVHASIFHVSCQLTCIEMPCNRQLRFNKILCNEFAQRFPSYLTNVESLDYCWYNSFPELHRIFNEVFEFEFDPFMFTYGVDQEIGCLLNNSLFSEVLRGMINFSVRYEHVENFIIFMTEFARFCCDEDLGENHLTYKMLRGTHNNKSLIRDYLHFPLLTNVCFVGASLNYVEEKINA